MNGCPKEELDLLVAGELAAGRGAEVEEHARSCARCGRELEWLRGERELMARWGAAGAGEASRLWPAVQQRLEAPRRARRRLALRATLAGCALAAGLLFALRLEQRRDEGESTGSAELALDDAEAQYEKAIAVLEAQIEARGAARRPAAAMARARSGLSRARAGSRREPSARVRLLEGYAAYLKSLRRELAEEEK